MYREVISKNHQDMNVINHIVFISHYAPSQINMYREPLTKEITIYNLTKGQFVNVKSWPIDSVQVSTDMIQWLEP